MSVMRLMSLLAAFAALVVGARAQEASEVVVELDAANVTFTLRYVPGFFKQGTPWVAEPASNPGRLGLLDNVTWADVDAYMEHHAAKLLLFLRHGEGIHNVAKAKYGSKLWDEYYRKLPEYTDAPLTAVGMQQAVNASLHLDTERHSGLDIEQVVVSPLERTLNTSMLAFSHQEQLPKLSMEWPREKFGVCTCDFRRQVSAKAVQYPSVTFSGFWSDVDPWWTAEQRETELHIDNRARSFLNRVFYEQEASRIGVVTHSGLSTAVMRVLGHRAYRIATAEVVPFLVEETTTHIDMPVAVL